MQATLRLELVGAYIRQWECCNIAAVRNVTIRSLVMIAAVCGALTSGLFSIVQLSSPALALNASALIDFNALVKQSVSSL